MRALCGSVNILESVLTGAVFSPVSEEKVQKPKSVPERYAPYALAAAALGIAAPAKATIITSYVNTTYTELDSPINFDIDGGGVPDYQLRLAVDTDYAEVRWTSLNFNEVVNLGAYVYAGTGSGGQTVDAALGGVKYWGTNDVLRKEDPNGGNWPDDLNDPRYIGLQFDIGPSTFYGWARVGVETQPNGDNSHAFAKVYEYSYNNVAGQPIDTGEVATPEPGTFSLFALGAAGIVAFKRRRRAA